MPKAMAVTVPARVLSVRCPWASLICRGFKPIENRSWPPPRTLRLPARIAIHASSKAPDAGKWQNFDDEIAPMVGMSAAEFRKLIHPGCIVGSVVVTGVIQPGGQATEHESPWYEGEFGWQLADARLYRKPIGPVSGKLNLWEPDARLAAAIAAAEADATPMAFKPPLVIPEVGTEEADPDCDTFYWDPKYQEDYSVKELRWMVEAGKVTAAEADRIRSGGPKTADEIEALYEERNEAEGDD